jgi:hypothetical protein
VPLTNFSPDYGSCALCKDIPILRPDRPDRLPAGNCVHGPRTRLGRLRPVDLRLLPTASCGWAAPGASCAISRARREASAFGCAWASVRKP